MINSWWAMYYYRCFNPNRTTVGQALAAKVITYIHTSPLYVHNPHQCSSIFQLGWKFEDGDNWHPEANVDKMSRGIALTDDVCKLIQYIPLSRVQHIVLHVGPSSLVVFTEWSASQVVGGEHQWSTGLFSTQTQVQGYTHRQARRFV